MVVQDYTSPGTEKQYFDALTLASNHDTLIGGVAAVKLLDIRSVQTAIKAQIPTAYISMQLMLQGFNILLAMLLKPGHRLVLELSHFNVKFMNKEPFYVSQHANFFPTILKHLLHKFAQSTHEIHHSVAENDTSHSSQV